MTKEKTINLIVQILRIVIAAPVGYIIGEHLQWTNFMKILLYFGVYIVVSLLLEGIKQAIFKNSSKPEQTEEDMY
ncbi:MAG: hypothetical protein U9N85_09390 [Bacteroidota bacterium]|nr:hypothetical protein [Bacteroidota bacterium]